MGKMNYCLGKLGEMFEKWTKLFIEFERFNGLLILGCCLFQKKTKFMNFMIICNSSAKNQKNQVLQVPMQQKGSINAGYDW